MNYCHALFDYFITFFSYEYFLQFYRIANNRWIVSSINHVSVIRRHDIWHVICRIQIYCWIFINKLDVILFAMIFFGKDIIDRILAITEKTHELLHELFIRLYLMRIKIPHRTSEKKLLNTCLNIFYFTLFLIVNSFTLCS